MMKKNFTALLIEDSKEDRYSFQRSIGKLNQQSKIFNITFEEATSLSESIELIKNKDFDIISLDLSLPDTTGLESLETVFRICGHKTPIIVLTGQEDEALALKAIKIGAQDYLQKKEITPFTLSRSIMYSMERSRLAKELEDLRVNQAKSLKMATLGEMAGGIAHEINNPLAIIMGYANRIKRLSKENEKEYSSFTDYADKIEKTTSRIAKIVKSLRAYSRKEDQDPMAPARLVDIIDDTLSICSESFKVSSIDLIVEEILDIQLLCKDIQLSQVLLNLLNNSHDAIKNNNKKWIRIFTTEENGTLYLYIIDSGEIVDPMTIKQIFNPFFTTKAKGLGTGLGMSISKNIINAHNGKIELVKGELNTTFRVSLPIYKKPIIMTDETSI